MQPWKCLTFGLCVLSAFSELALDRAARKGADLSARRQDRLSVECVHYRPAKWETQ